MSSQPYSVVDPFDNLAGSCGPLNKNQVKTLHKYMRLNRLKPIFNLILEILRISV